MVAVKARDDRDSKPAQNERTDRVKACLETEGVYRSFDKMLADGMVFYARKNLTTYKGVKCS